MARTLRTPKKGKLTAADLARFLKELAKRGNVTAAAKAAKIGRRTAFDYKAADPEFAQAWAAAMEEAADRLENEAFRRAHDGVSKPVFQMGGKVGTIREYSDTLLIFLLKGARPDKYAERQKLQHSGSIVAKVVRLPAKEDPS